MVKLIEADQPCQDFLLFIFISSTKASTKKFQVFINKCLRRIVQLTWLDRVIGGSYPEKEMEIAWSHPADAFMLSTDVESSREAKERLSTKHLKTFARSRDKSPQARADIS